MESVTKKETLLSPMPTSLKCAMSVYPMRLKPGQEIKQCLEDFVIKEKLNAAFILTCCGSLTKVTLRLAAKSNNEEGTITTMDEHFEICSLVGTISPDGSHLHTTLSRQDGSTIGGHVVSDMFVFSTAEIVLGNCEYPNSNDSKSIHNFSEGVAFQRKPDIETGYNELDISYSTNSSSGGGGDLASS